MHAAGPQSKRQCVFCAAVYCLQTALGTVRVWRFSAKCDIINSPTYRRPDCLIVTTLLVAGVAGALRLQPTSARHGHQPLGGGC